MGSSRFAVYCPSPHPHITDTLSAWNNLIYEPNGVRQMSCYCVKYNKFGKKAHKFMATAKYGGNYSAKV